MVTRKVAARQITADVISAMAERIVERLRPLQVILFGSRARGDARPRSDVDLLVVIPNGRDKRQARDAVHAAVREFHVPNDVIIATPDELARRGSLVGPIFRPALRDGKVLYDAARGIAAWTSGNGGPLPRPSQGGPVTDSERLAETRRWLRQGAEDLRVAELVDHGENAAPGVACYHAQQAAEKALKAVLVFLQAEFEKTHDLDELRGLIPAGWPVKDEYPGLKRLSDWAVEARYPGSWAEPTEVDAREATSQARAIWESVLRDLREHSFEPGEQA